MLDEIKEKIANQQRISRQEAEFLFVEGTDQDLSDLATQVRNRFHKRDEATYLIMAIINYTNICVAKCDYCSFYRLPHQPGTYLLSYEQIREKIHAVTKLGGSMVGFNGGFHPKLKISDYGDIFGRVRQEFGDQIEFYGMTVAEFMFSCKLSRISYEEGAQILKEKGSRWITGGGAEILDDRFRMRHSPGKFKVRDYFAAQDAILTSGMGSTATMVIGFDESVRERFNHLEALRRFQDEQQEKDRELKSFLLWTYKPYNNELGGKELETSEYLKWLAICRIYLDNFEHIRTSVLTKNEEALEGLKYGANDFDLPTEDEVTQKAGATISLEFERILDHAKQLGFKTLHRRPFEHQAQFYPKTRRSPAIELR